MHPAAKGAFKMLHLTDLKMLQHGFGVFPPHAENASSMAKVILEEVTLHEEVFLGFPNLKNIRF